MNQVEALKVVDLLLDSWPQTGMTKGAIQQYAVGIHDLEYRQMIDVVGQLARTDEFRPTIAGLRRRYYQNAGIGNAETGWAELIAIVKGPVDPHWQDRVNDKIAIEALMQAGGMVALRFSERPEFVLKDYREQYERLLKQELAKPDRVAEQLKLHAGGEKALEERNG